MLKSFIFINIFYNKNYFYFYKSKKNTNNMYMYTNLVNNIPFTKILNQRNLLLFDKFAYFNNEKNLLSIFNDINSNRNLIIINNKKINKSHSNIYYNSIWLEREVNEFFKINFLYLKDTRPLLLNYSDLNKILFKNKSVQDIDELKTSWLKKKIFFKNNKKIEL